MALKPWFLTAVCLASVCLLASPWRAGAQSKKDPLTEKQIEEVREAGIDPLLRIQLFIGYVDTRATEIQAIDKEAHAQSREARIHTRMDEFTRLSDDLADNLDAFDQDHADLRKALKVLVEKSTAWTAILNEPKPSPDYDFVRKTALDANSGVHETAVTMLAAQEKYFLEKKKADKEAEKKAYKDSEVR